MFGAGDEAVDGDGRKEDEPNDEGEKEEEEWLEVSKEGD